MILKIIQWQIGQSDDYQAISSHEDIGVLEFKHRNSVHIYVMAVWNDSLRNLAYPREASNAESMQNDTHAPCI